MVAVASSGETGFFVGRAGLRLAGAAAWGSAAITGRRVARGTMGSRLASSSGRATERGALSLRTERIRGAASVAARVVAGLRRALGLRAGLGLAALDLAAERFTRGAFGPLRMTRRTVRAALGAGFFVRGFLVFIPTSDPVGRCRVRSDASNITAAGYGVQREFGG
jgi:hypothetical protein